MEIRKNEKNELNFGVSKDNYAVPFVRVCVDGDETAIPLQLKKTEDLKGKYAVLYENTEKGISVVSEIETIGGALCQKVRVVCNKTHTITQAAANVNRVCFVRKALKTGLATVVSSFIIA